MSSQFSPRMGSSIPGGQVCTQDFFVAKKLRRVIILRPYTILPAGVTSVHLKPRGIHQFVPLLAGKHRLTITTLEGLLLGLI